MARALAVLLVLGTALVAVALPARAAAPRADSVRFRIDQKMIGRAPLGQPAVFYQGAYGSPGVRVARRDGFDRLVFDEWQVEVLFRSGDLAAVGVIMWNSRATTRLGVGACSRATTLVSAYGLRLERVAQGRSVTAYRLGRLVFVTGREGFVCTVGLLAPGVSVMPVLTAPRCGMPSVS